MNSYGDGNLPIVLKTTIVVQAGLTTKTVETVHDSGSVPAAVIGDIVSGLATISATNEPYGGGLTKQTVIYEGTDSESLPAIPATTYESQGSAIEIDIRQHPEWSSTFESSWDADKGEFKSDSEFYGISSYIVGSVSVTKTEYFSSQPADLYASIGTLEVPGGGYSGDGNWLIIGTGRRKVADGLFTREVTYQYSAVAWNSSIYS